MVGRTERRLSWAAGVACAAVATFSIGCSSPTEEDAASTGSEGSALTEARSDFQALSAALDEELGKRAATENGDATLHTASVHPLSGSSNADVCKAVGSLRMNGKLPNIYAVEGASAGANVLAGVSYGIEQVWDLTHHQVAVFTGREISVSGSAGVSAGIYLGLGLLDVEHARVKGEDIGHDVIDGWSGEYFGGNVDIEVPFKLTWASAGCVTDKDGFFFACNVSGGLGVSTDILPLDGDVLKGSTAPSENATRIAERTWLPHTEKMGEYDGKSYPYMQFMPFDVLGMAGNRARHARAAITTAMSMPLALALVAGPIALALGVDADLRERHGKSLTELCP